MAIYAQGYKKQSSSNIGMHLSYCKLVFMQNDGITINLYISGLQEGYRNSLSGSDH